MKVCRSRPRGEVGSKLSWRQRKVNRGERARGWLSVLRNWQFERERERGRERERSPGEQEGEFIPGASRTYIIAGATLTGAVRAVRGRDGDEEVENYLKSRRRDRFAAVIVFDSCGTE